MHKAMQASDIRNLLVKPKPIKLFYKLDKKKLDKQLGEKII
jgi:hypothetical protein